MTTTTKTNTIQFDQVIKLFKKFVARRDTRPALKLVQFDGGYFTATDSHIFIRVNAEYVSDLSEGLEAGSLIDPKINAVSPFNIKYPDTSRLIPDYHNSTIVLDKNNLKELHEQLKVSKKLLTKKQGYITLDLREKQNKLITIEKERIRVNETELNNIRLIGEEIKIHVGHKYTLHGIEAAKKLTKLNSNPLTVNFISNMRPISIKQEGVFDILVLPIRVN